MLGSHGGVQEFWKGDCAQVRGGKGEVRAISCHRMVAFKMSATFLVGTAVGGGVSGIASVAGVVTMGDAEQATDHLEK
eukprot:1178157-Rhodomonas_salina.1